MDGLEVFAILIISIIVIMIFQGTLGVPEYVVTTGNRHHKHHSDSHHPYHPHRRHPNHHRHHPHHRHRHHSERLYEGFDGHVENDETYGVLM